MSLHLLVVVHHQMVNVIGYILQISASVLAAALHCLGSLGKAAVNHFVGNKGDNDAKAAEDKLFRI